MLMSFPVYIVAACGNERLQNDRQQEQAMMGDVNGTDSVPPDPERRDDPAAGTTPFEQRPSEHAKTSAYSRGDILVAEDERVNQQLLQAMLDGLGYRVTMTNNGSEALAAAAQNRFDLVLMDCQMPVMDGYTATRTIREQEAQRSAPPAGQAPARLPIVALTADALKGDRERCLAGGFDDYLSKPYTRQQLRDVIQRWLQRK